MAAAGERNGLAGGVERGGGGRDDFMAAFAVIVIFSFRVFYFILKLSGEGNEDVLNLDWVSSVRLAFEKGRMGGSIVT